MNPEVMFFLPQLGGGGAEMNAARVSLALHEYGFNTSFAVCRGPGSYEQLLPAEIPVSVLSTGRMNSSTLRLIRSIQPLRKLIVSRQPAILCPVMATPAIYALKSMSRLIDGPKVVLSIQNTLTAQFFNRKGLRPRFYLSLIRRFYPRADHVVALSNGVAKEIRDIVPALSNRTSVIPNAGMPTEQYREIEKNSGIKKPGSGKLIVACGRLAEQKGYPYLLKAFFQVMQQEDVYLWIIGEGPLKEKLLLLAESLGAAQRVKFLGFQNDPYSYMRAADVFVLSSLWEGFGNVIVEAMATGTAVVATDCQHGPSDIIEHETNGLLVPPADEDTLATEILRVLGDDELRARLSANGQARAQDFSPKNIAKRYAEVFSQVLSS